MARWMRRACAFSRIYGCGVCEASRARSYADGERCYDVAPSAIRPMPIPAVGERIETHRGTATVRAVNPNGTVNLQYTDGTREYEVDPNSSAGAPVERRRQLEAFSKGDAVEARFKSGARWFSSTVVAVSAAGTYALLYDDGDREFDVIPEYIRRREHAPAPAPTRTYTKGERVDARRDGRSLFIPGAIVAAHRDGTVDIRYDDGRVGYNVRPAFVRPHESDSGADSSAATAAFKQGTRIKLRTAHELLPGVVLGQGRAGRVDIQLDSGERRLDMPIEDVQLAGDGAPRPMRFVKSDRVEVSSLRGFVKLPTFVCARVGSTWRWRQVRSSGGCCHWVSIAGHLRCSVH